MHRKVNRWKWIVVAAIMLCCVPTASASLDWENMDWEAYENSARMTEEEIAALPVDWNEHVLAYEVGMRKDWIYLDDGGIIAYGIYYPTTDDAVFADTSNESEITSYFYFTEDEIAQLPESWEDHVLPYSYEKNRRDRDWIFLDTGMYEEFGMCGGISYGDYYETLPWEMDLGVDYFTDGLMENADRTEN